MTTVGSDGRLWRPGILVGVLASTLAACNPYGCVTDYRSATYYGVLGQDVAPTSPPDENASGRVFLQLNEWRGSQAQQGVIAGVNVRGFVSAVSTLHVHEGTSASPGRVLWQSANGYLVGDSVWNTGINMFEGPGPWSDLWSKVESGRAYFDVHSPGGGSVSAGLRQHMSTPFRPACT